MYFIFNGEKIEIVSFKALFDRSCKGLVRNGMCEVKFYMTKRTPIDLVSACKEDDGLLVFILKEDDVFLIY